MIDSSFDYDKRLLDSMNHVLVDNNFTSLFRRANRLTLDKGIETSPRGFKIKELINTSFILLDPRHRLLKSTTRKHSYAYAVAELLWYLRGSQSLDELLPYAKNLKQFSDDGKTLNSAYGSRIFGTHNDFPNQWQNVYNKFMLDKDTRQAIININYAEDQNRQTKDVTCTLNLQFFIRNNKLHLTTTMRSNDSFVGFIYDVFCFTMLQELFLIALKENEQFEDLKLGYYIHNVNSFHIYERHFQKANNLLAEQLIESVPMPHITDRNMFKHIQSLEESLRGGSLSGTNPKLVGDNLCRKFDGTERWLLRQLVDKFTPKDKR